MTFTDDDLDRLKISSNPMDCIKALPALLARLEAAEALEPYWEGYEPFSLEDGKEYDAKIEAHRKAAGK